MGISALLLSMVCGIAGGKTIYVDYDAPGPIHNGSGWYYAYKYLQDALATARSGDEIRVAQGVYKPDHGASQIYGDREATFQLITGVTIKGGYAGYGEPNPDARDIQLYETILSGDLADNDRDVNDPRDLHYDPYRAENSYHVVTASSCDESAVLDGFTITGGNANRYAGEAYQGGGMYNKYGSPTVNNCTFRANSSGEDDYGHGGGMYNDLSSPKLTNCNFINNSSLGSGGMCANYKSNPTFTNCTFIGNTADNFGGGMFNESNSSPTLTNCIFTGNLSCCGGGINNYHNCLNPTLTNCTFIGNHSDWHGGAIYNSSTCTLTKCTFSGNSAELNGGAMYNVSSNTTITNCLFTGNRAGQEGGGIFNFGYYTEELTIVTNSTFTGNFALNGNTMAFDSYNQERPSSLDIINCIFYDGDDVIWNNDGSTINISYTDLQGGIAACYDPCDAIVWGMGNIDADPCFALPGHWGNVNDPNIIVEPNDPNAVWVDGDYHLKSQAGRWDPNSKTWVKDGVSSHCIDAGDPNYDWRGELWPHGKRINMGIYGGMTEASMSLSDSGNIADLSLDGQLCNRDIKLLIDKWLCEILLLPEDLSRDGFVNLIDFAIFTHHFELPARHPNPTDGAMGVNITADLSWTAGRGATSHDVYFGTNNPPPFIRNQTDTTFDPGTMDYITTYYWRIDEVNTYGTTRGAIWSFTTIMPPPPP
jgi:parallel beta-helix repeat protein